MLVGGRSVDLCDHRWVHCSLFSVSSKIQYSLRNVVEGKIQYYSARNVVESKVVSIRLRNGHQNGKICNVHE